MADEPDWPKTVKCQAAGIAEDRVRMLGAMLNALNRAARYRERADECAKLNERATDDRVREHYRQMAQN
jgi:hypothetical protein